MTDARVAIGMPVLNGANFIRPALDSLLAQTYQDFTILVSDNASTDETVAIVEEYMRRDPRISLQRHPTNIGAHRNYNSLVTATDGELFKWMAHDDIIAPTFLTRCVAELDADPGASLAFADSVQIDAAGNRGVAAVEQPVVRRPSPYRRLRSYVSDRTKIPQVFGVIRRSVLEATPLLGSYPKSDTVLMYEMVMRGRFAKVEEPLFLNREHPHRQGKLGLRERTAWYHPDRTMPVLPRWSQLWGFLRAVIRVPMPAATRRGASGSSVGGASTTVPSWPGTCGTGRRAPWPGGEDRSRV